MTERPKVIDGRYLRAKPPGILQIALIFTMLHYWQLPAWANGAILALYGAMSLGLWIVFFVAKPVHPRDL